MVATCFCLKLKIQLRRILKQIAQDIYSFIQGKTLGPQTVLQLDILHVFDIILFGLLIVLVKS